MKANILFLYIKSPTPTRIMQHCGKNPITINSDLIIISMNLYKFYITSAIKI